MEKNIIILPETDDRTLCVEIRGNVTLQDFRESFEHPIREIIARHGEYNVFAVYTDDHKSWDEDAADCSFKLYNEIGPLRRRAAFVNAPDSRHLIMKILEPVIVKGQTHFFDLEQRDAALIWAKERN